MGKIVSVAKAGYEVFKLGKSVVGLARKPAWEARKLAIKAARSALLMALKAAFGEKWAANLIGRLSVAGKSRQGSVELAVPKWLARWTMDPQGAVLVEQVVNDVLELPFELVGYKVAHARIGYDEESRKLTLGLELGVIDMARTSAVGKEPLEWVERVEWPEKSAQGDKTVAGEAVTGMGSVAVEKKKRVAKVKALKVPGDAKDKSSQGS
jgi:hypothetical protein